MLIPAAVEAMFIQEQTRAVRARSAWGIVSISVLSLFVKPSPTRARKSAEEFGAQLAGDVVEPFADSRTSALRRNAGNVGASGSTVPLVDDLHAVDQRDLVADVDEAAGETGDHARTRSTEALASSLAQSHRPTPSAATAATSRPSLAREHVERREHSCSVKHESVLSSRACLWFCVE